MPHAESTSAAAAGLQGAQLALRRTCVIGLIGFLTLVDLFATQAILPTLARSYGVSPAAMGFAVNASTFGMALAGLAVALGGGIIDRRIGIGACLALLAVPTALLAFAPDLTTFTLLRVLQGVFMASAFSLTMAYVAEHETPQQTASALAAYVTGVVASNLFGRMIAASATDALGLPANFYLFAGLNLAGATLVLASLDRMGMMAAATAPHRSPRESWALHLSNPDLRAAFAIGFLILFAFIGVFTYVNFILVRAPIGLSQMSLGIVYLVFAPAMVTTPLAGRVAIRHGIRPTFWVSLIVAGCGLPLLVLPSLAAVLAGMVLVAVGTFFAQATATGYVGRAATMERGAASGLYLASYYLGGLAGSAICGQLFDRIGWAAAVAAVGLALLIAGLLAGRLMRA